MKTKINKVFISLKWNEKKNRKKHKEMKKNKMNSK